MIPAPQTPSDRHPNVKGHPPGGLTSAEALARLERLKERPRRAVKVLEPHLHLCVDDRIARALMDCALLGRRFDVAEAILQVADDPSGCMAAQLWLARDDAAQAAAALRHPPDTALDRARFFGLQVRALALSGDYTAAVSAAFRWACDLPGTPMPYRTLARALARQDDPRAQDWFECAIAVTGGHTTSHLDLAEHLIKLGKHRTARAHLDIVSHARGDTARRRDRLLQAI